MKQLLKRATTRIFPDNLYGSFAKAVGTVSGLRIAGGGLLFLSQTLLAVWMGPDAFGHYSYAWAWVAVPWIGMTLSPTWIPVAWIS